jgi:hypothetical protein
LKIGILKKISGLHPYMLFRTAIGTDILQNLDIYRKITLRLILRKLVACAQTDREECPFVVIGAVNGRAAGM